MVDTHSCSRCFYKHYSICICSYTCSGDSIGVIYIYSYAVRRARFDKDFGKVFITLAFSAFALTSLDTATRLGRYIFQEYFETEGGKKSWIADKYVATIITVLVSYLLVTYGYQKIWPIFGSSNQMLSTLALLALTA